MAMEYLGLQEISGPLVTLDEVEGVANEEVVEIRFEGGIRYGRVVALEGKKAIVQVFAGTTGLGLGSVNVRFTGKPMKMQLAGEMLEIGRASCRERV